MGYSSRVTEGPVVEGYIVLQRVVEVTLSYRVNSTGMLHAHCIEVSFNICTLVPVVQTLIIRTMWYVTELNK